MCGINGFVINNHIDNAKEKLSKMNYLIFHRGPDSQGEYVDYVKEYTIAMGMRRLSIIDLNGGGQPIFSEDGSKIIVFNGEIYNFRALRDDLIRQGIKFNTNSDTEVILKLYEKEGVNSFSKLDGMFVFSIHDKTINKVFVVRDFFGEKPLFFTRTHDSFIWASELKSILVVLPNLPEIDNKSLSIYFQLTYIPAPYTIYRDIFKLESNSYIEFDCLTNSMDIKYIERSIKTYDFSSFAEATKLTHDLVYDSVVSRSVSDVPLGTFLSGGVDSSIVSLCLSNYSSLPIDTFSIGFSKKSFDESDKARLVSKIIGSKHHEFIICEKDLKKGLSEVILNFDEPFADSSALATYLVAKKTKEYVKVALTGDGGDEVFGGYNKYFIGKLNNYYTSLIPQKFHKYLLELLPSFLNNTEDNRGGVFKINRLIKAIDYNEDFYYKIISLGFQDSELQELFNNNIYYYDSLSSWKNNVVCKTINDFRAIDKSISLEGDMLAKVDRTSMLASLECRSPFLNIELWDFTNQLPESYLINNWEKKFILKESFKQYFPKDFLRKTKKGFGVPVGDWMRSELKDELLHFTEKDFIKKQKIFNHNYISNLVNKHINGSQDNTFRVWTFYCFQKWYKNNYN
jgi:asparagine synthase (glutamine-hydrolysing)